MFNGMSEEEIILFNNLLEKCVSNLEILSQMRLINIMHEYSKKPNHKYCKMNLTLTQYVV